MNKPNIFNNIFSFQNQLNDLFSSTSFFFFYFWAFFSKIYIFEIVTFFLAEWFSNQLNFSVAVRIYNIHVLMKHFSSPHYQNTKLFRAVTCCEELSFINMHDTSMEWSCGAIWQIKYISPHVEDVWTPN